MRYQALLSAVCCSVLFSAGSFAQAASAPAGKPPTVAEAKAFMDEAEAALLDFGNEAGRAAWVQETYITDDTEAISAKSGERYLNRANQLVMESRRFDKLTLPPELARNFMLLRLNGAPTDSKLVAELTKTAAALGRNVRQRRVLPDWRGGRRGERQAVPRHRRARCADGQVAGPQGTAGTVARMAAGDRLNTMLAARQSQPWQKTLQAMTGEDHLDAMPMLEYFGPLYTWLKEQNVKNGVKTGWATGELAAAG